MKITYWGHACFEIEENGYTLVIDPFEKVPGLKDVHTTADMVLCSHDHADHAFVAGVKRARSGSANPFGVTMMQTFHDDVKGKKRGGNLVHVITAAGKTIVHLGDLGHLLPENQLDFIRSCDCLMIPVGGYYTIDRTQAWEIIHAVNPKCVIPMHYQNGKYGLRELGSLAEFLTGSDRKIAVSTSPSFELPEEENILIVPAVKEV